MILSKHTKAFSMLSAIVIIIMISILSIYIMGLAGKTIKVSTDQYRHEQAILYAKSYTEYAILAVSADTRDTKSPCLRDINANIDGGIHTQNYPKTGYRVSIHISYISDAIELANCTGIGVRILSDTITHHTTSLNIIIDAYIKYRDLNDMHKVLTYHRRSLQKI